MRRRSGLASLLVTAGVGVMLASSLPAAGAATHLAAKVPTWAVPQGNAKFDYQIGQAYDLPKGVKVVSRDREAKPAKHAYNVCYVNAYQTQPQEIHWWKKNHNNLLLKKPGGGYVVDSYWGEVLLDVGTAKKRAAIAGIVNKWIAGCKNDGFDAVEPDNLDSWTRSQGQLTKSNNFDFAKLIIKGAHDSGLAIAQKNAAGQTALGKHIGFDFAVAEECGRWHECQRYMSAYGNQVFVIEYRAQDFQYSCNKWGTQLSVVLRDRNVTGPGSSHYVYDSC